MYVPLHFGFATFAKKLWKMRNTSFFIVNFMKNKREKLQNYFNDIEFDEKHICQLIYRASVIKFIIEIYGMFMNNIYFKKYKISPIWTGCVNYMCDFMCTLFCTLHYKRTLFEFIWVLLNFNILNITRNGFIYLWANQLNVDIKIFSCTQCEISRGFP